MPLKLTDHQHLMLELIAERPVPAIPEIEHYVAALEAIELITLMDEAENSISPPQGVSSNTATIQHHCTRITSPKAGMPPRQQHAKIPAAAFARAHTRVAAAIWGKVSPGELPRCAGTDPSLVRHLHANRCQRLVHASHSCVETMDDIRAA